MREGTQHKKEASEGKSTGKVVPTAVRTQNAEPAVFNALRLVKEVNPVVCLHRKAGVITSMLAMLALYREAVKPVSAFTPLRRSNQQQGQCPEPQRIAYEH